LSEAEARDPRTCVAAASSAHVVVKVVTPDGRAVVVKQVPRAAALGGRSLRQEMFVYRLARSVPALAAALPAAIHIDETRQVIVLAAVDGSTAWPATQIAAPGVVERLAVLMAGWHRATQDTGLWPSPALGILEMPDALALAAADRAPATQRLMAEIAGDRLLADTLRSTRATWRDRCLIHGDLRRENVLASPSGDKAAVTVIDWELSGSGDPAWDLAGVLTEVSLDAVRDGRGGGWSLAQQAVVARLVHAYVAAGGLLASADTPDAWDHVLSCTVARLLHVACEWAEAQVDGQTEPAAALVDEARALLARRGELADALHRWPSA
jgi:aminoglycoside phosphotransferase (APT) family kinase protein